MGIMRCICAGTPRTCSGKWRRACTSFPLTRDTPSTTGRWRQELGPAVQIQGGPTAGLLLSGSREEVAEETVRIIRAVKDVTRRFVLRDANNVSPGTPLENIRVMYDKVREAGVYETAEDESMTGSHR